MKNNIHNCEFCNNIGEFPFRRLNGKIICSNCIHLMVTTKGYIDTLTIDDIEYVKINNPVETFNPLYEKICTNVGFLILDRFFVPENDIINKSVDIYTHIFHSSLQYVKCGFREYNIFDIVTENFTYTKLDTPIKKFNIKYYGKDTIEYLFMK